MKHVFDALAKIARSRVETQIWGETVQEQNELHVHVCYIFGFTKAGTKGKEDLQPMKGTSLTDISDSGNTNSTVPYKNFHRLFNLFSWKV